MAISLVIEDGTNVPDSNCYVSLNEVRQYGLNRGIELSDDDDILSSQVIKATDYLESKSTEYKGRPTYPDQSLSFPRTCMFINDTQFPENQIPRQLKQAQCALVLIVNSGIELMPNTTAQDFVVKETVGPISTEYADPLQVGMTPNFPQIDSLLAPLIGVNSGSFALFTRRV